MSTTEVLLRVMVPYVIKKRRKWYLASCPILDVHSQGETEKKARKNLKEATSLFLIDCFERGTLEEVMKECGFKINKTQQKVNIPRVNYLDINLPMLVDQSESCVCRA